MWFDMLNARTVNQCGAKTVLVKTTGHEKSRFTVVLTCMADGTKLKPMVVFKRKTMPKGNFPAGVVIHVHPNGWMDDDGTKLWFEKHSSRCTHEKEQSINMGFLQLPYH